MSYIHSQRIVEAHLVFNSWCVHNMEKQQNIANCESMATTVTVKDYSTVDYQDPPPAYKNAGVKASPMVQTAKIIAMAAVTIAAMLSFALVFSAWLSKSSDAVCQYPVPSIETIVPPQALRSVLMGATDLDSAESKVESNNNKKDSSEEDRDSNSGEDSVTMFKFPVELNLQEHMFERNQRSHMNCIIEKKKAEEIVDEQAKPLPPLLGINMSTDPRYLHFTGEKMAISCDSGNDHRQAPPVPLMHMEGPPPPPPHHPSMQFPSGSGNIPIHIIGPIPLAGHPDSHPLGFQNQQHQNLIPIIIPQGQSSEEGPIFLPPPQHFQPISIPQQHQIPQSNEIRERALHHPIPIMPRQHVQHVIRPRSTDGEKSRVKRCACDCACKNHHNE